MVAKPAAAGTSETGTAAMAAEARPPMEPGTATMPAGTAKARAAVVAVTTETGTAVVGGAAIAAGTVVVRTRPGRLNVVGSGT